MFKMWLCASLWIVLITTALPHARAETWYVRPDGGTRYSAHMKSGDCDGKGNSPFPGSGVNRHCAFNDVRYLWDDQSYGNKSWVIAGGDTVVLAGCADNKNQIRHSAPNCQIGWDNRSGRGAGSTWCYGSSGNIGCYNPSVPSGTPSHPTRILGACAVNGACHQGDVTVRSRLAQLYGGFGVNTVLNLAGSKYVDVEGLEITSHNGQCIRHGSPADPRGCNTFPSPEFDDYADNGIQTDNSTSNLVLKDVYIHGLTTSGIQGPIGGPVQLTRVFIGFNGFAGWNFDDGRSTPDAAGSSILASYVTLEGNGCNEEYPIVHKDFPAISCYDSDSGGFGDSWSGQDTKLDSFTCDHCVMAYNTKDGFIGPHTVISHLSVTNSQSYGNMGQQWKWGTGAKSTTIFENNLTVGNCRRLSAPLPGAPVGFNRHLSLFCRAAGDIFSFYSGSESTVLFAGNSIVGYSSVMLDFSCESPKACGSANYIFRDNVVMGILNPQYNSGDPKLPALFYFSDPTVHLTSDHNLFYNLRSTPCSWIKPTSICGNPLFVHEPPTQVSNEDQLDHFDFQPMQGSPVVGQGQPVPGLVTDFNERPRPNPPSIGAIEPR